MHSLQVSNMFTHSHTQTIQLHEFNHIFGVFHVGEIPDGFFDIWKWPLWCNRWLDTTEQIAHLQLQGLIVLVPLLSWKSELVDRKVIDYSIEPCCVLVFCLLSLFYFFWTLLFYIFYFDFVVFIFLFFFQIHLWCLLVELSAKTLSAIWFVRHSLLAALITQTIYRSQLTVRHHEYHKTKKGRTPILIRQGLKDYREMVRMMRHHSRWWHFKILKNPSTYLEVSITWQIFPHTPTHLTN